MGWVFGRVLGEDGVNYLEMLYEGVGREEGEVLGAYLMWRC